MLEYYCDIQKNVIRLKDAIDYEIMDKDAKQIVRVSESIFGVFIRPERCWSPFCRKVFCKEEANGIILGGIWENWEGDLTFIRELPGCKDLTIGYQKPIDLSILSGNRFIKRLQLDFGGKKDATEFEFSSLPNLQQCRIPLQPGFMSALKCPKLVSLWLHRGEYDGTLSLEHLPELGEFICSSVSTVKSVTLNPKARLHALKLAQLKLFESITPIRSVVEELRVATLEKTPRLKYQWLAQADKLECLALRIGTIPTINFLKNLRNLQVLDLFGSKVADGDFAVRDRLTQRLDSKSWGNRKK